MTTHTAGRLAGTAPIVALTIAILTVFTAIGVMVESPATLPTWCATHGCP